MYIFYIIRIIESFSLVFAILNFAFHFISTADYSGPLFIASAVLSFLCCFLKDKNIKLYYIPVLLILLQVFFDYSPSSVVFTAIVIAFNFYFIKNDLFKPDYGVLIDEFKTGFAAVIILFLMAIVTVSTGAFGKASAPFLIIYLITSVILLRSLRSSALTKKRKYVNASNFIYCVLIVFISFILGTEKLRVYALHAIGKAYIIVMSFFIFLFSHVLGFAGFLLEYFFEALKWLMSKGSSKAFLDNLKNSNSGDSENPFRNHIGKALINSSVFHVITEILLLIIVLYAIYRIFYKRISSKKYEDQFTENKDFVIFDKKDKKNNSRKFYKPDTYKDYIRHYYLKFLRLADKCNSGITKSDTTLDINKKARANFNKDTLEDIRNIYIEARYSNKDMTGNDADRVRKFYKKLRKN